MARIKELGLKTVLVRLIDKGTRVAPGMMGRERDGRLACRGGRAGTALPLPRHAPQPACGIVNQPVRQSEIPPVPSVKSVVNFFLIRVIEVFAGL
jgi:hypothetical protein